jgi:hypothetical protein
MVVSVMSESGRRGVTVSEAMERPRFADHVDRIWAAAFGLDVGELHAEPLRIATPAPGFADYRGVYVLTLGATTLVSAPVGHVDADTVPLGPSQHAYLHPDDHLAPATATTRPVRRTSWRRCATRCPTTSGARAASALTTTASRGARTKEVCSSPLATSPTSAAVPRTSASSPIPIIVVEVTRFASRGT